jgi:hypothetical protein
MATNKTTHSTKIHTSDLWIVIGRDGAGTSFGGFPYVLYSSSSYLFAFTALRMRNSKKKGIAVLIVLLYILPHIKYD